MIILGLGVAGMAILSDHVIVPHESQPGLSAEPRCPAKKACLLFPLLTLSPFER